MRGLKILHVIEIEKEANNCYVMLTDVHRAE